MFWPACKLEKTSGAVRRVEEGREGCVGGREGRRGGCAPVRGRPCGEGAVTGSTNGLLSPSEAVSFVWY